MFDRPFAGWLSELADRTPTPGGGAVAGLSAALSAALLSMVANYTTGLKWQDRQARMRTILADLTAFREQALGLVEQDAAAFARVSQAYALPKTTPEQTTARAVAIQQATAQACQPPQQTIVVAARLVKVAEELMVSANPNVITDVAVAASNARAALEASIVNIEINQKQLVEVIVKQQLQQAISQALSAIEQADSIVSGIRHRITT